MSSKENPKCYNFEYMPNEGTNDLSERELDILKLVATGASNKEIAQKLFISPNTVKVHLRNIFNKIGASSRTEAAMYAIRYGVVEEESKQILLSEDTLQLTGNSELRLDQSISSNPFLNEKIRKKKLYVKYTGLFGGLFIILIFLGLVYLRGKIIPTTALVPPTTTPRVQWFELPGLPTPRRGLAVTSYENQIYAIGGESSQGITNTVERYDPQTNLWSDLASKPTSVSDISAVVIGGLIYVPGGRQLNGSPTDVTEIYDPKSDAWILGVSLPRPLSAYGLAVSEGRIYIFGGWDGNQIVNNAYIFDPQKNSWTEIPSMPSSRSYPGAVVVGRKIYVIGGWDGQKPLNTNEVYLPDSSGVGSQWTKASSLPSGRFGMGITNLADIIFIIGGTTNDDDLTMIALSQEDKDWGQLEAPLQKGWSLLGAVTVGTRLYALGGSTEAGLSQQMWSYQAIFTITLPIIR
jgi:DNA-binding CsgD family transcriptional regulator/N-acetylneuraminic acid mutarotase